MWKKTTPFRPGANRFFLWWMGVLGLMFWSGATWAQWPIEPPLDAAYIDWENVRIGISGKAPPHFLVSSVAQSRSSSEHFARLDAAERLFFLIRELRLSKALTFGECAAESTLKEALAGLLLTREPTAHWRFSDGGQSFFFELPFSLLAPFCPELTKALAELPALSAQEAWGKQSETKMLWMVSAQESELEPCVFPVLFSADGKWLLDTASEGYFVVWSAKAPAQQPKPTPTKATPSKKGISSPGAISQGSAPWAIHARRREHCGLELSNELAAQWEKKSQAGRLERRIVVKSQGQAR